MWELNVHNFWDAAIGKRNTEKKLAKPTFPTSFELRYRQKSHSSSNPAHEDVFSVAAESDSHND